MLLPAWLPGGKVLAQRVWGRSCKSRQDLINFDSAKALKAVPFGHLDCRFSDPSCE